MKFSDFAPRPVRAALTRQLVASDPAQRIFVIANPTSPQLYRALRLIEQTCNHLGFPTPSVLTTTRRSPGTAQARLALDQGADLVIAAGGDGTLRLVAGVLTGTGVNLGVVPIGAGNIFARNLSRATSLAQQVLTALTGSVARVDIGSVTCWRADGAVLPPEPMLTMAGIGRDAQAVAAVSRNAKNALGWAAYVPAATKSSLAKPLQFSASSDHEPPSEIAAWSILAANCPLVPLRVAAFPDAVLDDCALDRLDVSVNRLWQWGAVAAKGLANYAATPATLRYSKVRTLTVTTPDPLPVQIDGDVIPDVTQLRVTVQPGALSVRVDKHASTETDPAYE